MAKTHEEKLSFLEERLAKIPIDRFYPDVYGREYHASDKEVVIRVGYDGTLLALTDVVHHQPFAEWDEPYNTYETVVFESAENDRERVLRIYQGIKQRKDQRIKDLENQQKKQAERENECRQARAEQYFTRS